MDKITINRIYNISLFNYFLTIFRINSNLPSIKNSVSNPELFQLQVRYNVIGKYESIIDDSALVLKTLKVENVTFPAGQRTSGTNDRLRLYYDDLPIGMIRSLYKLYEKDFKLFGYSLDEVLGFELG